MKKIRLIVSTASFALLLTSLPASAAAVDNILWAPNYYGPNATAGNTVQKVDKIANAVAGSVTVGSNPFSVAVDQNFVWVANSTDRTISKINKSTSQIVSTFPVGFVPVALAVDDTTLWVGGYSDLIAKFNKQTDSALGTVNVGPAGYTGITGVAVDDNSVWVALYGVGSSLKKVDKATGTVTAVFPFNWSMKNVSMDKDFVWAVNFDYNYVVKINKSTHAVSKIYGLNRPSSLVADNNFVWVTNWGNDTVTKINKDTNAIMANIPVGLSPMSIFVDSEFVWAFNSGIWKSGTTGNTISKIDRMTNAIVAVIPVGSTPMATGDATGYFYDMFFGAPVPVNPDLDGDGIENSIDRNSSTNADESLSSSNGFNNGATFGNITDRGGWNVAVSSVADSQAVRLSVSGSGFVPARFVTCNNNVETQLNADGETADILCGSTTVTAVSSPNDIRVREPQSGSGGKFAMVKLVAGQTVTMGSYIAASPLNPTPLEVEIMDENENVIGGGKLEPGQTIDIKVEGDVVITNLSNNIVTFTLEGATLNLDAHELFFDRCPNSVADPAPLENRISWLGGTNFSTKDPKTKDNVESSYTMKQTKGCTCAQILEKTKGNEKGQLKGGCTKETLESFINSNNLLGLLYELNGSLYYVIAGVVAALAALGWYWKKYSTNA